MPSRAGPVRCARRRTGTAIPADHHDRPADLVERDFTATVPKQLWVADFTYVATFSGTVYVALAFDVFSRDDRGLAAATSMTTDLVLDTLEMAIWNRRREGISDLTGLVHHNDAERQAVAASTWLTSRSLSHCRTTPVRSRNRLEGMPCRHDEPG
jgi:transposase InsO family protein